MSLASFAAGLTWFLDSNCSLYRHISTRLSDSRPYICSTSNDPRSRYRCLHLPLTSWCRRLPYDVLHPSIINPTSSTTLSYPASCHCRPSPTPHSSAWVPPGRALPSSPFSPSPHARVRVPACATSRLSFANRTLTSGTRKGTRRRKWVAALDASTLFIAVMSLFYPFILLFPISHRAGY